MEKEVLRSHNIVVQGLVNGLSHVHHDGRLDDISFWRKRSELFEAFGRCVLMIATKQRHDLDEEDLMDIAREGYKYVKE